MSKRKRLMYDLILILPIAVVAAICLAVNLSNKEPGDLVKVEVNGRIVGEYSLQKDAVYILNNGSNTLIIRGGCAWLSESDCPDKTCIRQGKIKYNGQSIICLPNKLAVTAFRRKGDIDLVL